MNDYNLEPGEMVLAQASPVRLGCDGSGEALEEVVLTNKHLVLVNKVSTGFLSSKTYVKRCPLEALLDPRGTPQVMATKFRDGYFLQAVFGGETISLYFSEAPRFYAQRWASDLTKAALGDFSGIGSVHPAVAEVADMVDGVKGAFGGIFGIKPAPSQSLRKAAGNPQVTTKCIGCHAPLSGRRTQAVTCPYCDTKQTL